MDRAGELHGAIAELFGADQDRRVGMDRELLLRGGDPLGGDAHLVKRRPQGQIVGLRQRRRGINPDQVGPGPGLFGPLRHKEGVEAAVQALIVDQEGEDLELSLVKREIGITIIAASEGDDGQGQESDDKEALDVHEYTSHDRVYINESVTRLTSEEQGMDRRWNRWLFGLLFCGLILWASVAVAEEAPTGEELLRAVDAALIQAEDMTATLELVTTAASGATEERTLSVWQRGAHQRMVKLTAPARLRGVGLLAKSEDQLYVYLPAFGRVRRVAGQQRGEPFLGSNFTQDDFSRTVFSGRFVASLTEDGDEAAVLELRARESDEEAYPRMVMEVRKEDLQLVRLEFFRDGEEEPRRRLTFSEYRTVDGQPVAHQVVAEDLRSGSRSVATLSEVEVNTGLAASLFTRRQLQR